VEYLSTVSEPLILDAKIPRSNPHSNLHSNSSNSKSVTVLQPEALGAASFQDSCLALPTQADQPQFISQQSPSQPVRRAELRTFLSTFFTIFLAELGDKTQVTTLLMSAESHAPWVVFAGAGTALVATSLIGVWLGCWLAKRVSAKTLETATGGLLLLVSVLLLWDVVHL
jgi:putative Ca2+/H+ antiporter (TMEM165/GDT1 family)